MHIFEILSLSTKLIPCNTFSAPCLISLEYSTTPDHVFSKILLWSMYVTSSMFMAIWSHLLHEIIEWSLVFLCQLWTASKLTSWSSKIHYSFILNSIVWIFFGNLCLLESQFFKTKYIETDSVIYWKYHWHKQIGYLCEMFLGKNLLIGQFYISNFHFFTL